MRGPDGGSLRDPDAVRPEWMWKRDPARTDVVCKMCSTTVGTGRRYQYKHRVYAVGGPKPGLYLICTRCDGGVQNGV